MSSKPVALLEMPLPSVTRYSARVTCVLTVCLFVIAGLVFVQPCLASQLLAQGATAADKVLGGSTVAQPKTPVGAMFANPAALALFSGTVAHLSVGVSFIDTEVDASAPAAYKDDNSFLVLSPGIGLSVAREGPWHYGLAGYGSVGTKFDFDADPAAGVDSGFFSEVAIFTSAVGVAYRFNDRLSVGAAIMPLLGLLKMRFTQQDIPFKYDLIGPGIQGMVGLRWRPREGLAVGLGVRTPGRVWMDGSMPLAGGEQDVDLEIKMPTQVFLGITKHFGERVTISARVTACIPKTCAG